MISTCPCRSFARENGRSTRDVPRPQDLPPLDGLTAALGKFEFFLVVAGEVEPAAVPPGHRVTIRKAGVFMQDDYDFGQLFQPLGNWDIEQHRASYDFFGCLMELRFPETARSHGYGR
jgi:hypothetical protein